MRLGVGPVSSDRTRCLRRRPKLTVVSVVAVADRYLCSGVPQLRNIFEEAPTNSEASKSVGLSADFGAQFRATGPTDSRPLPGDIHRSTSEAHLQKIAGGLHPLGARASLEVLARSTSLAVQYGSRQSTTRQALALAIFPPSQAFVPTPTPGGGGGLNTSRYVRPFFVVFALPGFAWRASEASTRQSRAGRRGSRTPSHRSITWTEAQGAVTTGWPVGEVALSVDQGGVRNGPGVRK